VYSLVVIYTLLWVGPKKKVGAFLPHLHSPYFDHDQPSPALAALGLRRAHLIASLVPSFVE
jgi:hypothetical protein